jgi:hypothetical protein
MSGLVTVEHWGKPRDLFIPAVFQFDLNFYVPKDFGVPGAIIVNIGHKNVRQIQRLVLRLLDQERLNRHLRNISPGDGPGLRLQKLIVFSNQQLPHAAVLVL